jgi:hypothetical protein
MQGPGFHLPILPKKRRKERREREERRQREKEKGKTCTLHFNM